MRVASLETTFWSGAAGEERRACTVRVTLVGASWAGGATWRIEFDTDIEPARMKYPLGEEIEVPITL